MEIVGNRLNLLSETVGSYSFQFSQDGQG